MWRRHRPGRRQTGTDEEDAAGSGTCNEAAGNTAREDIALRLRWGGTWLGLTRVLLCGREKERETDGKGKEDGDDVRA